MARFFGLRGRSLHAAVWVESWLAIMIFGYCSASAGGVLNMPAFREQFPSIDVTDAPESEKHNKSTIQGASRGICCFQFCYRERVIEHPKASGGVGALICRWLTSTTYRNRCGSIHALWGLRCLSLYILWRHLRATDDNFHCCWRTARRSDPDGKLIFAGAIYRRSGLYRPGHWCSCSHCAGLAVRAVSN